MSSQRTLFMYAGLAMCQTYYCILNQKILAIYHLQSLGERSRSVSDLFRRDPQFPVLTVLPLKYDLWNHERHLRWDEVFRSQT